MCISSPMPHTLSYCALIGKCAQIRSHTVNFMVPSQFAPLKYYCTVFSFMAKGEVVKTGYNYIVYNVQLPIILLQSASYPIMQFFLSYLQEA